MLVNFETKSARVKGVSFHPKRPWVLASLHNGCIQLWDYRMQTLVDKFEEHDGPVRGVSFHPTQPLFVSGGDDYKIKVWNYKQRKCLFTLNGHLDYIRTVFFHHEYPWIISASDDQTIRIWNWQSRNCITILTGHAHYVMCAQFHPREDLIVSASLDTTVRVWDISGLRKKNTSAPTNRFSEDMSRGPSLGGNQADVFGNTDVLLKYQLEGHERGVNWAAFHPSLPFIVTGADDRQVKLWRMSDTKAWEVDTCRGHYNNVSCVLFHPKQELIISDSEDKSIRVWDMNKRTGVQTFRRETERFWVLTSHPEKNIFAAGHDTGLIVFKFERERPAFTLHQDSLFYVRDKTVRHVDLTTGNDCAVIGIKKAPGLNNQPRTMSYNAAENSIILTSPVDGGVFDIYQLPKELNKSGFEEAPEATEVKRGTGTCAVFVARNRYAVLNKATQSLEIRTLNGDSVKPFPLSGNALDIFQAGVGQLIISCSNSIQLADIQTFEIKAELSVSPAKYAVWSSDMQYLALFSRFDVIIANGKFEQLCRVHETMRVKGGVWDESGVLIYCTLNHIKYALPQGDSGIICTIDEPIYLVKSSGKTLYCLDRSGKCRLITIDPVEFRFKMALSRKRYDEVMHIIRNSNLVGQAIIAYLTKKGYPEVALQFVKEPKTRFALAIECGNMEVALEMAKTIEDDQCWSQLGSAALKQGNVHIMEFAYQRFKDFEKLAFSYLITAENEKLQKMGKIAQLRGDLMSQYNYNVILGNIEGQIEVLRNSNLCIPQSKHVKYSTNNLVPLAYATALKYGHTDVAAEILSSAGKNESDVQGLTVSLSSKSLCPLKPMFKDGGDWPCLPISRGFFEQRLAEPGPPQSPSKQQQQPSAVQKESVAVVDQAKEAAVPEVVEANWGIDDDLEIEMPSAVSIASKEAAEDVKKLPNNGPSFEELWTRNSCSIVDYISAGSFDMAMQTLNRQIGICEFEPLKPFFMSIYLSSRTSLSMLSPLTPSHIYPLNRDWKKELKQSLPSLSFTFNQLQQLLQQAYAATTSGQFQVAVGLFRTLLLQCLFVVVDNEQDALEAEKFISIAREYIVGLSMEMKRRELGDAGDMKRNVELAAYFTHCDLQPIHLMLSLQLAMTQAYKAKCFSTTSLFVKRLLELGPNPQIAEKARKLQAVVESSLKDELKLEYSPLNQFSICSGSFTPIFDPSRLKKCSFCKASFKETFAGKVCNVCQVGEIGKSCAGFKVNVIQ